MSLRDRFRPPARERDAAPGESAEARAAQALGRTRGRLAAPAAPPAGKAVAALLKPLLKETGIGLGELQRRWAELAGESFARASPEKLAGGVLTLRVPGALAPFLQQQTPLLIERLKLAGARIKTVRLEQRTAAAPKAANLRPLKAALAPEEETALAQALDPVADPGLKSALMRLGRAVKQG